MVQPSKRTRPVDTDTIKVEEARISVYSSYAGTLKEHQRVLSVRTFESQPAYVRVSKGTTHNMGDYESCRVDVSVTLPCYPEEVDTVALDLCDLVSVLLENETKLMGVSPVGGE